jgi:hypothetical protein
MERHMDIAYRCTPWKIANGEENLDLQALQFQQMGVCSKFPGGRAIRHCRTNKSILEGQFNISI